MATKSHVLMDFKDLDTAPPQDIHNKLKTHRYSLRNSSLTSDSISLTREDKHKHDRFRISANPHPLMMRPIASIPFIISILAFALFIPIIIFVPRANIILDRATWLVTALAVAIKIGFNTLELDARLMEPFYRLSCRHAHPKVLTLDYTTMAIGYMPLRAALNGDYLIALLGVGSILAEVLTVCVTSLAGVDTSHASVDGTQASSETPNSFWASFSLSMFILAYLVVTASAAYTLRRHAFLPRQPSTIASVLAFVHQSKMLYDFIAAPAAPSSSSSSSPPSAQPGSNATKPAKRSSSFPVGSPGSPNASDPDPDVAVLRAATIIQHTSPTLDQDALVARLADMGKTYGLGWFTGRDGETHCGVDQEELREGYKHGAKSDARKASKPWLGGDWRYL
jgi:hypothetical protein